MGPGDQKIHSWGVSGLFLPVKVGSGAAKKYISMGNSDYSGYDATMRSGGE